MPLMVSVPFSNFHVSGPVVPPCAKRRKGEKEKRRKEKRRKEKGEKDFLVFWFVFIGFIMINFRLLDNYFLMIGLVGVLGFDKVDSFGVRGNVKGVRVSVYLLHQKFFTEKINEFNRT